MGRRNSLRLPAARRVRRARARGKAFRSGQRKWVRKEYELRKSGREQRTRVAGTDANNCRSPGVTGKNRPCTTGGRRPASAGSPDGPRG